MLRSVSEPREATPRKEQSRGAGAVGKMPQVSRGRDEGKVLEAVAADWRSGVGALW